MHKQNEGSYRDVGLALVSNTNGPKLDNLRKKITTIFKAENLSITIETNLKETDLLDMTFNLHTS